MLNNTNTLELVLAIIGVAIIGGLLYNLYNAIADHAVVKSEEINGGILQASKDALRTSFLFLIIGGCLGTLVVVAMLTPTRPSPYRWASTVSSVAMLTIYFVVAYAAVEDARSRLKEIARHRREGETIAQALQRAKYKRRRKTDPPLTPDELVRIESKPRSETSGDRGMGVDQTTKPQKLEP